MPASVSAPMNVSAIQRLVSSSSTAQLKSNSEDYDKFLKLLVAQLKFQDPMQPTDPTAFMAQLAQFSTVEQLVKSNDKLDTLNSSFGALAMAQNAMLIGKVIEGDVSSVAVPASGMPESMTYRLNTGFSGSARMEVLGAGGEILRTIPLSSNEGMVQFDGRTNAGRSLPPGSYNVRIISDTTDGQTTPAGQLYVSGMVRELRQQDGALKLVLSDGRALDPASVRTLKAI